MEHFSKWKHAKRQRIGPAPALLEKTTGGMETGLAGALREGRRNVAALVAALDSTSWKRTDTQRLFHQEMLNAALPYLYGWRTWREAQCEILRENGICAEEHRSACLVVAPRRFGKTTSVSLFCACYLYACPNAHVSVFSSGRRASSALAQTVIRMLAELQVKPNVSNAELVQIDKSTGDCRRMYSYPATTTGTKGAGGGLLVLEEAAIAPLRLVTETVAPLLQVEGTALFAISTPCGQESYFDRLCERTDEETGKSIFRVVRIQLLCEACKRDKKTECPHLSHLRPPWLRDEGKRDVVKAIMAEGEDGLFEQEALGVAGLGAGHVFSQDAIGFLRASRSTRSLFDGSIFVAIDPNGGGSSRMAIVCAMLVGTTSPAVVILGAESWKVVTDADLEEAVPKFVRSLREHFRMPQTLTLTSVIERNFGGTPVSSRIASLLARSGQSVRHFCPQAPKVGVVTSASSKERMRIATTDALNDQRISFHESFCSSNTKTRQMLCDEMAAYRYVQPAVDDILGKGRRLTGKTSSSSDDLAICLQIAIFWGGVCLSAPGHTFAVTR